MAGLASSRSLDWSTHSWAVLKYGIAGCRWIRGGFDLQVHVCCDAIISSAFSEKVAGRPVRIIDSDYDGWRFGYLGSCKPTGLFRYL